MKTKLFQYNRPLSDEFFFLKKEFISDLRKYNTNQEILEKYKFCLQYKGLTGKKLISYIYDNIFDLEVFLFNNKKTKEHILYDNKMYYDNDNGLHLLLNLRYYYHSDKETHQIYFNTDSIIKNSKIPEGLNFIKPKDIFKDVINSLTHVKIDDLDDELILIFENKFLGHSYLGYPVFDKIYPPHTQTEEYQTEYKDFRGFINNFYNKFPVNKTLTSKYLDIKDLEKFLKLNNFNSFYDYLIKLSSTKEDINLKKLDLEQKLLLENISRNQISISLDSITLIETYGTFVFIHFNTENGDETYIKLNFSNKENLWNININNTSYLLLGIKNHEINEDIIPPEYPFHKEFLTDTNHYCIPHYQDSVDMYDSEYKDIVVKAIEYEFNKYIKKYTIERDGLYKATKISFGITYNSGFTEYYDDSDSRNGYTRFKSYLSINSFLPQELNHLKLNIDFNELIYYIISLEEKNDLFEELNKPYDRSHLSHYEIFKNHDDLF